MAPFASVCVLAAAKLARRRAGTSSLKAYREGQDNDMLDVVETAAMSLVQRVRCL